jgi:NAD+ synthase (glutamine-hydrolysing)
MIILNGELLAQSPQFSLNEVDVITATVDLEEIRAYRQSMSRNLQAARSTVKYHRIQTPFELSPDEEDHDLRRQPTVSREPSYFGVAEEVALVSFQPPNFIRLLTSKCAGCYLWDYLARSKSTG